MKERIGPCGPFVFVVCDRKRHPMGKFIAGFVLGFSVALLITRVLVQELLDRFGR